MSDQPGLRRRMRKEARRMSAQHDKLEELHALVAAALEEGDPATIEAVFLRYRDALDAHFEVEDRMFLPALHGLRPELDRELAEIAREHDAFRETLDELRDGLADGPPSGPDGPRASRRLGRAAFAARLRELGLKLEAHELREERLVGRITGRKLRGNDAAAG